MRRESDTLRPGDRAPEFTLQDASGRAYSLNELLNAGTKVPAYEERLSRAGTEGPASEERLLLVFDRGTW